jgi:Kef-type K+ transport system membrane component KefB
MRHGLTEVAPLTKWRSFLRTYLEVKMGEIELLLLEITIVLTTTLLCGWLARKLGQSRVIGEIAGGILLGPALFGRLAPRVSALLFPQGSIASLEVLSTIGLILFVFLIGSRLDLEHLKQQKTTAALASGMSILLPCAMAAVIAPPLRTLFAPSTVKGFPFFLFLGVSMSITAFPVLARILEQRGLLTSRLGSTALMCAAVDDVGAWILLAFGLALVSPADQGMSPTSRLIYLALYLLVMFGVLFPLSRRYTRQQLQHEFSALSYELLAILILGVLASAAATDAIGVHPLFGAFVAGLCFPRIPKWQATLSLQFDLIVSTLLLPFFFVLTGMRTRLDLLNSGTIWRWTTIVIAVSVAGKMGGAVLAARWTGESWNNAFALGALLNTRGLVELIVLNVAYEAHVFSSTLFTMFVAMAFVTTMMTTPLLNMLGVGLDSKNSYTEQ